MASVTSRGDGVWEVAVGSGASRTSRRVHGTYADALAAAARMEQRRGSEPRWAGVTLDAYFSQAFMPSRSDLEQSTLDNYATIWRLHVSPRFGSMPLAEPSPADVQAWALTMSRGASMHAAALGAPRCVLHGRIALRAYETPREVPEGWMR